MIHTLHNHRIRGIEVAVAEGRDKTWQRGPPTPSTRPKAGNYEYQHLTRSSQAGKAVLVGERRRRQGVVVWL